MSNASRRTRTSEEGCDGVQARTSWPMSPAGSFDGTELRSIHAAEVLAERPIASSVSRDGVKGSKASKRFPGDGGDIMRLWTRAAVFAATHFCREQYPSRRALVVQYPTGRPTTSWRGCRAEDNPGWASRSDRQRSGRGLSGAESGRSDADATRADDIPARMRSTRGCCEEPYRNETSRRILSGVSDHDVTGAR